jgi:hypothetical protein
MIVSWPARITATGIRRQYTHAVDIVPTLYECLEIEPPETLKGYTQVPLEGITFATSFDDESVDTGNSTQFYSMGGTAAIWHEGWKAASLTPSAPDMWADYAGQTWELFDATTDPTECRDLAEQYPDKLRELVNLWWVEAGKYNALPLENRGVVEILGTERPQIAKPRNRYLFYPGTAEVPESVAPNIRNRSCTVAVEVNVDSPDASGGSSATAHGSVGMPCMSRTGNSSMSTTGSACSSR